LFPSGLLVVIPVSLVEMVAAVAFLPFVRHPVFAAPLRHIFALLPDVPMCARVPIPVARRVDVTHAWRSIFNDDGRWRDFNVYVDSGRARERVSEP
jgi:hypothetical protein